MNRAMKPMEQIDIMSVMAAFPFDLSACQISSVPNCIYLPHKNPLMMQNDG